jgi:mRNA interferase HigB
MRIIARHTLKACPDAKARNKDHKAPSAAINAWFGEVRKAKWRSAADVKTHYATASIISGDRIVFNIKSNDYRLVVAVDYEKSIVWIKWLGSHKNYDRINVKDIEFNG